MLKMKEKHNCAYSVERELAFVTILPNTREKKLIKIWHTGIPGLRTQEMDAGLWILESRRWTLDAGL